MTINSVFALFAYLIVVAMSVCAARAAPAGFEEHKFNGPSRPSYNGDTVTFAIFDRQCSNVDYGDGRGESDCKNGNVRSTLRYSRDIKIGKAVEYSFDFRIDPSLKYEGFFNKAAQGYYPDGWDSSLRFASWEGPYIHNFIYMLKADTRNGVTFLARQCQQPREFGTWVKFSMKIFWSSGKDGWIRVACDGKTVYAADSLATNQSPHCWRSNECEPGLERNPKSFNFLVGPVLQGWGPDFAKNAHTSLFETIQSDGIKIQMRGFAVKQNAAYYSSSDSVIAKDLQTVLSSLGCFRGPSDGKASKDFHDAALTCRTFPAGKMPKDFNVVTMPDFLKLYRQPGVVDLPKPKPVLLTLPKPKYKMSIGEEVAVIAGDGPTIKSFLVGNVKGQKRGQDEIYFGVTGYYDKAAAKLSSFSLIVVDPLSKDQVKALYKCGGGTERFIEGTEHAMISFKAVEGGFQSNVTLDCLSGFMPKTGLRVAKFLFANFRDVALGLESSGNAKLIRNGSLKEVVGKIARGEITISGQ